jgi:hypothetical protein
MAITTDPTDLKIALLEARLRELEETRKAEVLDIEGLPPDGPEAIDAALGRLFPALPPPEKEAFMLELRRRAALLEALRIEYCQAKEELQYLRWRQTLPRTLEEFHERQAKALEPKHGEPRRAHSPLTAFLAAAASIPLAFGMAAGIYLAQQAVFRAVSCASNPAAVQCR